MTAIEIQNLKVGDLVQRTICTKAEVEHGTAWWSNPEPVDEIFARNQNVNGQWFVCFYTVWHENGRMSGSITEGEYHVRMAAL